MPAQAQTRHHKSLQNPKFRQRTYFSMALITSPLGKSRHYPFVPTRRLNIRNGVSLALNVHSSYPKLYELRTNGKREKIAFFAGPSNKRNDKYNGTPQAMAEAGGSSLEQQQEEWNCRRIFLSDVTVKRERKVFWGRKWNTLDVGTASVVLSMHLLSLFAPFCFNWSAFWVAFGLYVITGLLGITLSFHRNLSHRSFKLPKWLEYLFAYCGVLALQGNPIDWVSTHRYHHQFCDSEQDPHSPIEGFWFSHMSWLFDTNSVVERCGGPNNVGDLEKQPFYKFIQDTYILHPFALAVLLYACGGVPFLVWGMGVRTIWVYHITWLVNSACHVWGKQAWNTGDLSRNNWWVAILAFGEGWHNNHHAFEYSARHGLEWWQLDMTWYVVMLLQVVGLATEVKLPTQLQKQRKITYSVAEAKNGGTQLD